MKSKTLAALAGAGCTIVAAAVLVWRAAPDFSGGHARTVTPLSIVPPGAALVATIDVTRLAGSASGKQLVDRGAGWFGFGGDACAAKTLQQATSIALAVEGASEGASASEDSELALIASGNFDSDQVARCVEQTIAKKNGQALRSVINGFVAIRDQRARSGEVAVRPGGPLVFSNGRYLREILDAAEGRPRGPSELERARDALHAELRKSFGKNAPIIATITLPRGWLERSLGDRDARLSPLSELRSAALRVEPAGDGFWCEGMLTHTSPEAAASVQKLLTSLLEQGAAFGPRLTAELTPERSEATLRLKAHLGASQFERLFSPPPSR